MSSAAVPEMTSADPRRRYELQVEKSAQGRGVGKALTELLQRIAQDWSMDKAMLTVFKSELSCLAPPSPR